MENRRLTAHFNLYDFLASDTAVRLGLVNEPHDPGILACLTLVAQHLLEPVQAQYNTRPQVTSGYRCPELNQRVGGVATSQHLRGQAVDFQLPGVSPAEVARWMAENLEYDQLLLECNDRETWIHASYAEGANRKQVKWFDGAAWHAGLPESA